MKNTNKNPNIDTVSYADGQLCRNDYQRQVTNPIELIQAASPAQSQALHQIQHKAAVYDQLSAALKGGADLLSKQFEYPAGESLAQEAYTLLSSACGHKFGSIPTFQPLKESPEEAKKAWPITIGDTELEQLKRLDKDEAAALILATRTEAEKQNSPITIDTSKVKTRQYIKGITVENEAEILEHELWPGLKERNHSQDRDYQPGGSFSTAEAIQEFADYIKLKELSQYTIENNYLPFLKRSFKDHSLVPTDPKLIRRLLAHYTNRNTRRTYWLYLSTFYSFLEQEHDIPNPMRKVPKPKESKTLPDHLNPEQKELLLKAELRPRDRALIDLLIVTGLRPSDIADTKGHPLRFCDIYADHIEVAGKGDKGRSVPIPPELRVTLISLQDGRRADSAVFSNNWGRPLTTWGLRKLVRRAFTAAGITGVKLTPYTIRHSFGGDFLAAGGNLASLQRILGHASVKTTMIYTHLSDKAVADDYQRHMPGASNCLLSAHLDTNTIISGTPAELLPQLLDQLEQLGETAKELKQALGSNGHRADKLEEIKELLEHRANK